MRKDQTSADDQEQPTSIRIATYNIRNGRAGGLEAALRAMGQMNVDLGVGIYTRRSAGYQVLATDAPSAHQGGIAVFWRDSPQWQVEAYRTYGPNVVSFQLTSGKCKWYVVGAYIPPADTVTLEHVSKALDDRPEGVDPILLGDLNANLADPVQPREHEIAAVLASQGLEDMMGHFAATRCYRAGYTWKQSRQGVLVTSRCDYLLGVDRRAFSKVCLKDPRFDSDHFMILGVLRGAPLKVNQRYLRGRQRFPIRNLTRPLNKAATVFEELKLSVERGERKQGVKSRGFPPKPGN
jgi:hypothetical protein